MRCPVCGKPSALEPRLRPFCGKRCADVDLGRWLTEQYAAPAKPEQPEEDEPA